MNIGGALPAENIVPLQTYMGHMSWNGYGLGEDIIKRIAEANEITVDQLLLATEGQAFAVSGLTYKFI